MWECAAGRKLLSGRCAVTFIFADFDMAVAIIPGVDVRGSNFPLYFGVREVRGK